MANRMTKKEYFTLLSTIVENTDREDKAEILGFLDHEIDLLANKSANRKPTKTQIENGDIKQKILTALKNIGRSTRSL